MMGREKKEDVPQREISFGRLIFESLPEMWSFQLLFALVMVVPVVLLSNLINMVAGAGGEVVTTANIKSFLFSWRFPVILLLGLLLVIVFLVVELFAQIYLTDNILRGQRAGVFGCVGSGTRAVKRFMNPGGLKIILFIFIIVPLCGVGFTISLSESFYVPNFIMEVVLKTPVLLVGYIALILLFIWIGFRSLFVLHAILLDGMKPAEARKYSARLVKENLGSFLKRLIWNVLVVILIITLAYYLLSHIPGWVLGGIGEELPKNYRIDFQQYLASGTDFSELEKDITTYRVIAIFAVLVQKYLMSVVVLLCGAYLMMRLNQWYMDYSGKGRELWPERPRKKRYLWRLLMFIPIFVLIGIVSVFLGLHYDYIFTRPDDVKLVAHRAGGNMAPENSIEGLEKAIEHGCYACEIDVQRTKDGYYIINHDNDFKRLTGVDKTPGEMTLAEIKELRIKDTSGQGQDAPVPTLEEMLDVIKGRVKLFVELKGVSADKQMVDDVVKIIRDHDCLEDTALISLDYDIINYAETNYPEFETGTLFFASLGDVSRLNCDLLIMEEETATDTNINFIHDAGKQAIVWTVNTEPGMYHFLDSWADAIITDEVPLAEEVQKELDNRTDLEVLEDQISIY
ncbi:MAG: glycerophosphoryl diester phosphodiesterase membrane domain-containing protein [Lachnospiraceae bacterium]|nr:glycerophosphoryl diester phosphodiesterase membrane domain-containing protein [Lachnospiraceae bacterium]